MVYPVEIDEFVSSNGNEAGQLGSLSGHLRAQSRPRRGERKLARAVDAGHELVMTFGIGASST